MASDIRFADDRVEVDAFRVRLRAADLELEYPERRVRSDGTTAGGDYRRAMVHSGDDTLIINFANDYSGGVRINGRVSIEGQTRLADAKTQALTTTGSFVVPGTGTPFLDDIAQREQREREARGRDTPGRGPRPRKGPGSVTEADPWGGGPRIPPGEGPVLVSVPDIQVGSVLIELAREVSRLRNRVAELESRR